MCLKVLAPLTLHGSCCCRGLTTNPQCGYCCSSTFYVENNSHNNRGQILILEDRTGKTTTNSNIIPKACRPPRPPELHSSHSRTLQNDNPTPLEWSPSGPESVQHNTPQSQKNIEEMLGQLQCQNARWRMQLRQKMGWGKAREYGMHPIVMLWQPISR